MRFQAFSPSQEPSLILLRVREVALEREVEGDLFLHDIGQGFGFRPGSFDGAIRYVFPFKTHSCIHRFSQYIRHPMAPERRNFSPDIITTSPTHALLHNTTLRPTQSISSCTSILSHLRRPDSAHHLNSSKSWIWWRCRSRLSELEEGEEGILVSVCG